jgi:hypothetical protein
MTMLLTEPARWTLASTADSDIERRRGLRIRQNRPVKVLEPTSARYFGGQTADISSTGLRIELPLSAPILIGKVLSLHLGSDGCGQPLGSRGRMIPARVVWVNRSGGGAGKLFAGVEFIAGVAARLDAA